LIYSIFLGGQDERTPVFRGSHISWGNMIEFSLAFALFLVYDASIGSCLDELSVTLFL